MGTCTSSLSSSTAINLDVDDRHLLVTQAEYYACLSRTFLAGLFPSKELRDIYASVTMQSFDAGRIIFDESAIADKFYIISQGEIALSATPSAPELVKSAESSMKRDQSFLSTYTSRTSTSLLSSTRQQRRETRILERSHQRAVSDVLPMLLPDSLFQHKRTSSLVTQFVASPAIDIIQHKQDKITDSFAAMDSPLSCIDKAESNHTPNSKMLSIRKKSFDCFGADSLDRLHSTQRRTVCVKTTMPTTCLVLSIKALPSTMFDRLRTFAAATIESVIKKISIFRGLSSHNCSVLSQLFSWKIIQPATMLFSEGDINYVDGNALYYLYSGTVSISLLKRQKLLPKILNAGVCFGEFGLFIDIPRTATICSNEKCVLLVLERNDFRQFLALIPSLWNNLDALLDMNPISIQYMLKDTQMLANLKAFCKKKGLMTNYLDFWLASRAFRKKQSAPHTARQVDGAHLISTYITDNSPHSINLDSHMQQKIIEAVFYPNTTRSCNHRLKDLLLQTEQQILILIAQTSFRRFRQTSTSLFRDIIRADFRHETDDNDSFLSENAACFESDNQLQTAITVLNQVAAQSASVEHIS